MAPDSDGFSSEKDSIQIRGGNQYTVTTTQLIF